ncbi:MAG: bifunctional [glutamine synthetase] adenylyltransferase/[glutamine synthetase]-adenylyl-L-tyrosine phosphorylase [Geminicoccaceae bacterium]
MSTMTPRLLSAPLANDAEAAEAGWRRWRHLAALSPDPALKELVESTHAEPVTRERLDGLFAGSPFLTDCLVAEPQLLAALRQEGSDAVWSRLRAESTALDLHDRTRLMASLRRQRRRVALLVGLADLWGLWPLERVTEALTSFADAAVRAVVDHLLIEGGKRGELALADPERPSDGSGLVILAMGKHGARELNYSSDIDLIVLFDEERVPYRGGEAPMAFAVRLARSLVYILETRTKDGYVFRTDLRLRPHLPGHPLALSTEVAELYYERHGQNWERAALIKARPVAGDMEAGQYFMRLVAPFVWRRSLDYAAIRDIHSIKRQINAYRGYGTIKVAGHDLKVGRGGIREIEFFAQTQQLILGGRAPELRLPGTCEALTALASGRWIDSQTSTDLIGAYRLLRSLEHRLQMVADRQTQALPERESELERFAAFAGFPDVAALESATEATLLTVERHYAALFEKEPDLGAGGSLVFTGTADDPATIANLTSMGFKDAPHVSSRLRSWHHGHIRATRSTRARELLTELTPAIFEALRQQGECDTVFKLFDEFVSSLPAGVQLFSLLRANPRLLTLIADLMGTAPRLARHLSSHVDLFDAMLGPDFFERLPSATALAAEFERRLVDARDVQDVLDLCRRWAHGRQFQAGLQVLLGLAPARHAAETLTAIAEVALQHLLRTATDWLVAQHGAVPGGAFAVIGLGKLGSRELTTGSDLDLVFVYDAADEASSKGKKPLAVPAWYARLGQRLVSAVAAKTSAGTLYEIDMRLRPSGNVGPVATSLGNFRAYNAATAQTWEQQALTRARAVAGDPDLCRTVDDAIWESVARPRDLATLAQDVRAMRERIFRERGSEDPWLLKHARGGIVELEFAAQYLKLAYAHELPALRTTEIPEIVQVCGDAGLIDPDAAEALSRAHALYQALQAVCRLSLSERFDPRTAPLRLLEALVRAAGLALEGERPPADFADLQRQLVESQTAVRQIFASLCPPGATA